MSKIRKTKASPKTKKNFYASAKSGFTLVELSLSLAFIGVLLIIITVITINITSIYQKGLALKAVNSVGRSLVDEFTDALKLAPRIDVNTLCKSQFTDEEARNKCVNDQAQMFVFQQIVEDDPNSPYVNQQLAGIFCTGYYSYIWRTEQGIRNGTNIKLEYSGGPASGVTDIHLFRIEDRSSRVCASQIDSSSYKGTFAEGTGTIDIRKVPDPAAPGTDKPYDIPSEPVDDFLQAFDMPLELYNLTLFPIARNSANLQSFMTGTFILATERGGVNIGRSGDYCQVSNETELADDSYEGGNMQSLSSDFNYCAINKFNFAARATGQD